MPDNRVNSGMYKSDSICIIRNIWNRINQILSSSCDIAYLYTVYPCLDFLLVRNVKPIIEYPSEKRRKQMSLPHLGYRSYFPTSDSLKTQVRWYIGMISCITCHLSLATCSCIRIVLLWIYSKFEIVIQFTGTTLGLATSTLPDSELPVQNCRLHYFLPWRVCIHTHVGKYHPRQTFLLLKTLVLAGFMWRYV